MSAFPALEAALAGGFHPGSLILVAGRPGMGKTSFLKQIETDYNGIYLREELDITGMESAVMKANGRIICLDFDTTALSIQGIKLKELAQKYGVSILVAASVSRNCERRENKRPCMVDLPPDLTAAADVILALYRESYYHGGIVETLPGDELILLKNAYGNLCTIPMTFQPSARIWSELEK